MMEGAEDVVEDFVDWDTWVLPGVKDATECLISCELVIVLE